MRLRSSTAAAVGLVLACGGEGTDGAGTPEGDAPAEPAVWALSAEPLLEIGVVSGEEPYQLHRVNSATRLPDGRIVAANSGSSELRFFDAEGRHLTSQGRRGKGPGEWLSLDRVRLRGPDTLLVVDARQRRNGLVSTDGEFLGTLPWRDELFPSDQFLHGRFIVDAPLPPEERGSVTRALDRSDEPDSGSVAFALATPTAQVWVTQGPAGATGGRSWRVYDLEGRRIASLETPRRFQVHDVGPDWVLGVARDEVDVQHVRLYALEGASPGASRGALAEAAARSDASTPDFPRWPTDSFPEISSLMKNMAYLQERHYADHYRYTTSVDTLLANARDVPENIRFEPIQGNDRGWWWRVVDEERGGGCTLSYGAAGVLGMTPKAVVCFGPAGAEGAG